MISLKDISKECCVSVATVSKALNDHSDISEETKRHVREVAERIRLTRESPTLAEYTINLFLSSQDKCIIVPVEPIPSKLFILSFIISSASLKLSDRLFGIS